MIRLGKMSDLDQILNLVEEAKELMKEHDNEQWDDQYPLLEHFEEDIAKDYLYVLEENDKIYGFIVVDQDQAEWYDDIDWPVNREALAEPSFTKMDISMSFASFNASLEV